MAKYINNYSMSHGGGGEEREKGRKGRMKKGRDKEREGKSILKCSLYRLLVDMTSERKRSL